MTETSAGGRDPLARQVLDLAQQLGNLTGRLDQLGGQIGSLPADLAALAERVEQLPAPADLAEVFAEMSAQISTLAAQVHALQTVGGEDTPAPVWDLTRMSVEQRDQVMAFVRDWVRDVLITVYDAVGTANANELKNAPKIPPCWDQHPDLIIELAWLCQEWMKIYRSGSKDSTPAKAGDWHERHLPGVRRRVASSTASRCTTERGHYDPAAQQVTNSMAPPYRSQY